MFRRRRRTIFFVLSVALLAGAVACSSGDGFPPDPGVSGSGAPASRAVKAAPTASPTPPSATPEEYQRVLTAIDTALGPGFGAIGAALTPQDLSGALSAVAVNLSVQAGELDETRPPAAVAAGHEDLSAALGALSRDLSALSGDADDQVLCTGGSGLPRAASGNGAHLLRLAATALATADPGHPYTVGSFLPAGGPDQTRRPGSGGLPGGRRGGYGELTVSASGSTDAVVKLLQGGEVVRSVYVQGGGSATVDGIPNGTYEAFYTVGNDWDDTNRRFTRDCDFSRFDESLSYTTTDLGSSIQYSTYQLTLYAVVGGNASTSSVPPGSFPGG